MPNKSKNQKKRGGAKSQEGLALPLRPTNEDEDSMVDNWSTQSVLSDDSSFPGSDQHLTAEESAEDTTEQENFEDKFCECLDNTLAKNSSARVKALQGLQQAMQKKFVSEFLGDRKETITDNLVRCLRKGKEEEQTIAALCLSLLATQIGPEAEASFLTAQPLLLTLMTDNATNYRARGACANALAVCSFLCCDDLEVVKSISKGLVDIFKLGYGQGENSPLVSPEQSWLIGQALSAWSLLLTLAPQFEVQEHIDSHLGPLQDLLRNSAVDLRMTAGEVIALMYELARDADEDFDHKQGKELCELLKQLATDSVKYRAKKERKQQRSCFRDVQRFIVDGESPVEVIKLGKENLLEITSWSQKRQYDALCGVLMTGMSTHLRLNPVLREIFELSAPGVDDYSFIKSLSKAQRTFINAAAFKARTKVRAKQRDKRSVTASGF